MREQIIGLVTPMTAVVFMIAFLVLWRRGRMDNYVLAFAASYGLFAVGFGVTHLFDTGSLYVFHATQFFYTMACAAALWGMANRVGQPAHLGLVLCIYAITAATLAVAVIASPDIATRLIIVNMGYGAITLVSVMCLLGAARRTSIDKLIIAMQALIAAQFFVRPVLTLLIEQTIPAEIYRESVYYSVLSLSLALLSMLNGMVLIGACIHDMLRAERSRAEADLLTGLRARRAFEQDAVAAIERAKQEDVPLSLVVADIDHFKSVNDIYGHQVGDAAIASVGEVVAAMIRNSDVAGRIGGEEFCILAWNCDAEAAEAMAERIRRRIGLTQVEGLPADHRLTASFGVAARGEGEGYGKLFARADSALYRAKNEGRDRVCAEHDMDNVTAIAKDDRAAVA